MDTRFTPGLWSPHYDEDFDTHSVRVENAHEVGYIEICEVGSGDAFKVADANLIAAAPDLYAALEPIIELLKLRFVPEGFEYTVTQAEAALAKARGESSK